MRRADLLERLGVGVLGWEFLGETPTEEEAKAGKRPAITGTLPNPPDALWEALEGKRKKPVFWCCGNPNEKLLFYVAEAGHTAAELWDPLENEDQLRRIINEAKSTLGCLPYDDDGARPKEICEAILKALEAPTSDDRLNRNAAGPFP